MVQSAMCASEEIADIDFFCPVFAVPMPFSPNGFQPRRPQSAVMEHKGVSLPRVYAQYSILQNRLHIFQKQK